MVPAVQVYQTKGASHPYGESLSYFWPKACRPLEGARSLRANEKGGAREEGAAFFVRCSD